MKKSIALIMALSVLVCGVFAACSSKKTDGQNSAADTTQAGLANADTEFGTEINKDGKEVIGRNPYRIRLQAACQF